MRKKVVLYIIGLLLVMMLTGCFKAETLPELEPGELEPVSQESESAGSDVSQDQALEPDKKDGSISQQEKMEQESEEAKDYAKRVLKGLKEEAAKEYDEQLEYLSGDKNVPGQTAYSVVENIYINAYIVKKRLKEHMAETVVFLLAISIFTYKVFIRKDKERSKAAARFVLLIIFLVVGVVYFGDKWNQLTGGL